MIVDQDVVNSLTLPAYTTDMAGRITSYNAAVAELWGRRPPIGKERVCGSWRLYHNDGTLLVEPEHPVAKMLRDGCDVEPAELVAERPDGSRVPFVAHPSFIRNEGGEAYGIVSVLVRTYDTTHHALELERLAAIVASSDDAIISKRLDGRITSWNESATRIFGYPPEEMIGQPILRLIPPELHKEEEEIISRLRRGERIEHYDTVRVGKDGRRIDVSLTVSPLRDRTGVIVGASKVARDVTDRKRAEELRELLFHELNHRVKNTLATIQAIASQSLRMAPTAEDFVEGFSGRLKAIGAAQSLLVQKEMAGADVADLIRDHVTFGEESASRVSTFGTSVMVDPKAAVQLALVLHELATNARKYGALSLPGGRLRIIWDVSQGEDASLFIRWTEAGVVNLSAPTRKGFGTTLIQQSLEASGGRATIEYKDSGIQCELVFPLPADAGSQPLFKPEEPPESTAPEGIRHGMDGAWVLIVEDEPLIAMELQSEFERQGARVRWAPRITSALNALLEQHFDIAVLDGNLDGDRVDEVAAELERRGIPFVFGTGYGADAVPKGFGHVPVISKPFHLPTLLSSLLAVRAQRVAV